jgi:hypothetical protein
MSSSSSSSNPSIVANLTANAEQPKHYEGRRWSLSNLLFQSIPDRNGRRFSYDQQMTATTTTIGELNEEQIKKNADGFAPTSAHYFII